MSSSPASSLTYLHQELQVHVVRLRRRATGLLVAATGLEIDTLRASNVIVVAVSLSSTLARLDLSPEIPQRRPTRGRFPPTDRESRADELKTFLPFIPARARRSSRRRDGSTSRASSRRGVSPGSAPRIHEFRGWSILRIDAASPTDRDHRASLGTALVSRSFRVRFARTILCVSSRDAERRMALPSGKALSERAGGRNGTPPV